MARLPLGELLGLLAFHRGGVFLGGLLAIVVSYGLWLESRPGLSPAGDVRVIEAANVTGEVLVHAKRKGAAPEPTSWVRQRPAENIEDQLPKLTPTLSHVLIAASRALCDVRGRLTAGTIAGRLESHGVPRLSAIRPETRVLSSSVQFEILTASVEGLKDLRLQSEIIDGRWQNTMVQFFEAPDYEGATRREIIRVTVDDDCLVEDAILFHYDSRLRLQSVEIVASEFRQVRPVIERRKSLSEIYASPQSWPAGKTLSDLMGVAQRRDRVIVGVYDSGVDYNHPGLAYKILRSPFEAKPEFQARLGAIQAELAKIRRALGELGLRTGVAAQWHALRQQAQTLRAEALSYSAGWAFDRDDDEPFDFVYEPGSLGRAFKDHGTHVSGLVVQNTDDVAVLPLRYAYKGERDHGVAIRHAHRLGARIINISLGSTDRTAFESLEKAVDQFADILFVVSAGNDGKNLDTYQVWPAGYQRPNMIVVGATFADGRVAPGANYSTNKVDLTAPGVEVTSLVPVAMGGEAKYSGTSQAAPQVTRAAARIKFLRPDWSPVQIRQHLCDTADRSGDILSYVRCGRLNEEEAVARARVQFQKN